MGKKSKSPQKKAQDASPSKETAASPSTSSAASALFGAQPSGSFDTELDALFKVAPAVPAPAPASSASTSKLSKRKAAGAESASPSSKKARAEAQLGEDEDEDEKSAADIDDDDEDAEAGDRDLSELDDEEMEAMAEMMDADDLLEDADEDEEVDEDADADRDEDDEEELAGGSKARSAFLIVHESLQKKGVRKPRNAKFEDIDEPAERKDKRTLFIGNVPIEAVKSKSLQKRLRRHLVSLSPYPGVTKITSLRFRSIPFAVPTDDFTAESEEAAAKLVKRRERSKNYKEALAVVEGKDAASAHQFLTAKQKRKVAYINQDINSKADTVNAYVTLGYPDAVFRYNNQRRLAKQQQQQQATEVEADGEAAAKEKMAKKSEAKQSDSTSTTAVDEMAGFDRRLTAPVVAALVASVADGQLFEGRHLRVDLVKPLEASEVIEAGLDKVKTAEGSLIGAAASGTTDPKRTLFVGNLDFEVKEEEIRSFFEKLLTDERGAAPETLILVVGLDGKAPVQPTLLGSDQKHADDSSDEEEDEGDDEDSEDDDDDEDAERRAAALRLLALHAAAWVRSVRVIRDKATQMGKGIAYVRFLDTECVDEIMAIHEAEDSFFASVRGGAASGRGGAKVSNTALASTAIAVGGKQSEFRRRLKLRGRVLRVSRCKATTNSVRKSGQRQGQGQKRDERGAGRPQAKRDNADEPRTPARNDHGGTRSSYRSSGAPTPNGSSPNASSSRTHVKSTSAPLTPTKSKPPPASAATLEKASMLSKLGKEERAAFKRNDAERQQRRMEKKNKKKAANKIVKDVGTGREKVKLPSKTGDKGKGKKSFSGAAAQAKKAKAASGAAAAKAKTQKKSTK